MATGCCKSCNKSFKYFGSQAAGLFCSRACHHDYRIKLIVESGMGNKTNAKTYLNRFTKYECAICKVDEWNGSKISLQVDHIDGNNKNNKADNVRWLCPNCHSQTPTWGARNASEKGRAAIRAGGMKGNLATKRNNKSCLSITEIEQYFTIQSNMGP